MSESLELKYERSGCLEAVREEEALPSETRNTLAVFLQFFFFFWGLCVRFHDHTHVRLRV